MKGFKLGTVNIENGLFLAPMAGVTDRYFRRLCASCGAEYAVTEMVSAKALCYEKRSVRASAPARTAPLAFVDPESIPTAVQIFGSEPQFMAEAAKMLSDRSYRGASGAIPAAIDINMGCPVKKVVSCGEGSALMKTPHLAGLIVESVKEATHLPVTVKIRAGWDKNSINAVEMAKTLESAGADAICVHGRTREQFYAPSSDNRIIADVKNAVNIPVIGNGDINTVDDAIRMYSETNCDGIMLARGTLGNPWLFAEIKAALNGNGYIPPSATEKINIALEHTRSVINEKGEGAVAAAKGQLAWYVKGIRGAADARNRIMSADTFSEMEKILLEVAKNTHEV